MAKAYWVVCYHSMKNPDAFAAYAKLAAPSVQAAGGRYLVRGSPAKVYEEGLNQRVVVIEFESLQKAIARAALSSQVRRWRIAGRCTIIPTSILSCWSVDRESKVEAAEA